MKKKKLYGFLLIILSIAVAVVGMSTCSKQDEEENAEKIPILAYHKIVPTGTEFETGLLITEETFDEQMKYLSDKGFKTLTLDEFYSWYKGELNVPEKSVVITFDDGYYGTHYLAEPIIKKYNQAAAVFCIGHHIEDTTAAFDPEEKEDHYIGRDVIENTRSEYPRFAYESHTYDMHRKINDKHPVKVYSYEQIVEDIEKNADYGFRYLAYPWGDYSDDFKRALEAEGYKMAFAYTPYYYATKDDDIYAISRIKISGKMGMKKFRKIVNGDYEEYDRNNEESE